MSTATTVTEVPVRLDIDAHAPTFSRALTHLDQVTTKECDRVGLDHRLRELLRLRVSQLNACAYCVDMHAQNARAVGEDQQRLDALPVWRETGFFSPAERAALTLAEAMVRMADDHVPEQVFTTVAEQYDTDQVAALVAAVIVTVTAWNGVGVTTRAWPPGSYQP